MKKIGANKMKDLSPQEIVEELKEYARLNRLIVDLKEVSAIEWKKCDDMIHHDLDHSVRFHMKNGKQFQRRMTWKHIKKVMDRFKLMNKTLFDCTEEE